MTACPSCAVFGYTKCADCERCWWRTSCRNLFGNEAKIAWAAREAEKGADLDAIRKYWEEVVEIDRQRNQADVHD